MGVQNSLYFIFISIFLIFSCQEEQKSGNSIDKSNSLDSKYKDLEGFEWLSNVQNFQDESYHDKFNHYFEQSQKDKKFEDAAGYLIAYGSACRRSSMYDSIYVIPY